MLRSSSDRGAIHGFSTKPVIQFKEPGPQLTSYKSIDQFGASLSASHPVTDMHHFTEGGVATIRSFPLASLMRVQPPYHADG